MGTFFAIFGSLGATGKDLVSKGVALRINPGVSTFASFVFALPFYALTLLLAWAAGMETFTWQSGFWTFVFLRALTDVFAEGFKMKAMLHADVSIVASFISLTPIFTALIAPWMTGDRLNSLELCGIVIVITGSLLLIKRPSGSTAPLQLRGILFAIAAAFGMAVNGCFDQLAVHTGTPIFSGFAMTALAGVLTVPTIVRVDQPGRQLRENYRALLLRGFFEMIHMVGRLLALQFFTAAVVSGMQRISLLFSIILGAIIFGEKDLGWRLTAGTIILVGVLILSAAQY